MSPLGAVQKGVMQAAFKPRRAYPFRRGFRCIALLVALLASGVGTAAAQQRCATPPGFPNPGFLDAMQRGVNLPGWDVPDIAQRPQRSQLQVLRQEGFGHIRLPLDNRRLAGAEGPDYVAAIYDEVINLLSLGFVVSLDLHADRKVGDLFREQPQQGEAYLDDLWQRLLPMVSILEPSKVAVELLNEPQIDQDRWMAVAERLVGRIRATLSEHTIIVGPAGPQRHEMLSGMAPFADRNIVYAVHYYDPFLFTHQGATWGAPDDPLRYLRGLPFPAAKEDLTVASILKELHAQGREDAALDLVRSLHNDWNEKMIAQAFDVMAGWAAKYQRPVIINEFGVLSYNAPRDARLRWLGAVNRLATERCLGWAHWDFKDGFGLVDPATGLPDRDVMRALAR